MRNHHGFAAFDPDGKVLPLTFRFRRGEVEEIYGEQWRHYRDMGYRVLAVRLEPAEPPRRQR